MTIKLNAATGGGSVSLSAPNSTTSNLNVELTLPVDDGAANTFLRSDGSGTLSWAAASSDSITEGNTTVECVDTGSDGHITFDTEGSEAARFDSSQRLLVGTSSARTNFPLGTSTIQHETAVASLNNGLSLVNNGGSAAYNPTLTIGVTRGTSVGQNTALPGANYGFGRIDFAGADGTNLITGARIEAFTDGTPGTNDMPGRLLFNTTADGASSPTERMRITSGDSNGALFFFNCTEQPSSSVKGTAIKPNGSNGNFFLNATSYSSSYTHWQFYNPNGLVGTIATSGSSTSYNTSSDYRLKENVIPLTGAAERLNQLQVRRFNFIADPDTTVDGFIAHEAQAVVPEAVTGTQDEIEVWKEGEELPDGVSVGDNKLDEDGNTIPVYQGIDQSKLVPLLTAALQEALAKIETLETANASLEARLTALEGGAS